MTCTLFKPDPIKVDLQIDDEGHRTYKATYVVKSDDRLDGPYTVKQCPGLPTAGSTWSSGNDDDQYAYCLATGSVQMFKTEENTLFWLVDRMFSTKPVPNDKSRCQDSEVKDPLLEPFKISGSGSRFQEAAVKDRWGVPIQTSSHEQVLGPGVEFDADRHSVKIVQNVAVLGIELWGPMTNTLNDVPLWGLPARCWKLAPVTWERKFYGQCNVYYTRTLEFEGSVTKNATTGELSPGWDRDLQDESSKVLNGHWGIASRGETEGQYYVDKFNGQPPDPSNPSHFIRAKDPKGENMRVVLNGQGLPGGVNVVPSPATVLSATILDAPYNDWTDASFGGTPLVQPPSPTTLTIRVKDDNNSISEGFLHLFGLDAGGARIQEVVDFSDAGTMDYQTRNVYAKVTGYTIGNGPAANSFQPAGPWDALWDPADPYKVDVQAPVSLPTGGTASDTLTILTATRETVVGNIHVEKYNESNFLLLNIPLEL